MSQATLNDVLRAVNELHGDVKVALDRTENQAKHLSLLDEKVNENTMDIAHAKGHAGGVATIVTSVLVAAVEVGKAVIGRTHGA